MNIDFNKLINLLMPTFLRTASLSAIYKAVSTPLTLEYDQFKVWQSDMRLQAAITCQVMYLEAILNYRLLGNFLRTIYITDGDGITVDFIVNIPAGLVVNGQLLVSLIEKYKLKGKRYSIGQSTVTYEVSWTDPVCELVDRTYEVSWTDPVCELEYSDDLVNNLLILNLSLGSINIADGIMSVTSQYNVTTELTVEVRCILDNETKSEILTIPNGSNSSQEIAFHYPSEIIISSIYSINPDSDSTYHYTH